MPQRVIRTEMIDKLERGPRVFTQVRALRNALTLRKLTDTSLIDLLKEGRAMRKQRELTLGQLSMAANAPMLTRVALVEGRLDAGILPTGQVAGLLDELPTVAELLRRIMVEANETLERLTRTMPERTLKA
jgi:NAD(P)H-dependent flavin oxidoreductase YrpB (nitropropane dioxygenase family)